MEVRLLGNTSEEFIKGQVKTVATAGRLTWFKGDVFQVNNKDTSYEDDIKYIERIISLGHNSITDHDYLVFGIKDVSPIIEQILIEERFSSFTIKSRREVNFKDAGFYIPDFHYEDGSIHKDNEYLKKCYANHMNNLFDSYSRFIDNGIPKEDARFLLPYCFNSNIIMGIDAHVLMNMIVSFTKGKYSNIGEVKEFGNRLYAIMENRAPYLKKFIDNSKVIDKDLVREELINSVGDEYSRIIDKPKMLSCPVDVDGSIFISAIMRVYGCDYDKASKIYYDKVIDDMELKNKLIRLININKEELKQVNFRYQIPITYASLTHLTRHRTLDLLIPDFVPVNNLSSYKIPDSFIEKGYDLRYREIFMENEGIYRWFKNLGVRDEDLIYFHLSGNMVNVICNIDGASLEHFASLRCCNRAQWEIRNIANEMVNLVRDRSFYFSSILGPSCEVYRRCNEGKKSCGKIKKLINEDKEKLSN